MTHEFTNDDGAPVKNEEATASPTDNKENLANISDEKSKQTTAVNDELIGLEMLLKSKEASLKEKEGKIAELKGRIMSSINIAPLKEAGEDREKKAEEYISNEEIEAEIMEQLSPLFQANKWEVNEFKISPSSDSLHIYLSVMTKNGLSEKVNCYVKLSNDGLGISPVEKKTKVTVNNIFIKKKIKSEIEMPFDEITRNILEYLETKKYNKKVKQIMISGGKLKVMFA